MIQTIYWPEPKKYDEVQNMKLPFSLQFITQHIKGELYAIGICSTHEGITFNELNSYFNY